MEKLIVIIITLLISVTLYHQIKDFLLNRFYFNSFDIHGAGAQESRKRILILFAGVISIIIAGFIFDGVSRIQILLPR